jgi:hypothetical protein
MMKGRRSALTQAACILAMMVLLTGCSGDDLARSVGESCAADAQCDSNLCYEGSCISPAGDADGDGLTNEVEVLLGTSPVLADSDNDGIGDAVEIGSINEPVDSDGDGVLDALESSIHDDDCDGFVDENDAEAGTPMEACVPVDTDGDGEPDANLPDQDGDGVEDLEDCEPSDSAIQRTCPPSEDSCSTVTCVPGKACVSEPYECPVGDDPCVTRTCDGAGGCDEQPTECAPSDDPCATAVCDPTSGECTLSPIECEDDGDPCSTESCAPESGECTSTPVVCAPDDELCTTESCDPASGECVSVPVLCGDDGDPCTVEACDPTGGTCTTTPVACEDDGLACTTEGCSPTTGDCHSLPILCLDDGDPCTDEACQEATGLCAAPPAVCPEDDDVCTTATCDSDSGCGFMPLECPDDGNACTIEHCVPDNDMGCSALIAVCNDDGDPCTLEACDEALGCIAPEKDCDDQDPCTVDSCDDGLCGVAEKDCDDQNPCTTDSCDETSGECVHAPISCTDEDDDACTVESCDVATGECASEPINCDTGDACEASTCEPETGDCSTPAAVVCDDQNPCTTDGCDSEVGCTTTNVDTPCNDGFVCTVSDLCTDGACVGTPVACDDDNPCTSDTCDEAIDGCVFSDVDCSDDNLCTADVCDSETGVCSNPTDWGDLCVEGPCLEVSCAPATGCHFDDKACDDGDVCTTDACDPIEGCVTAPFLVEGCEDHACWLAGCAVNDEDLPSCQYEVSAACDDGQACTRDECAELAPDEFGCLSTALSPEEYCPAGLPACTYTTCVENAGLPQCVMGSNGCSDGIACTIDICDDADFSCSNTPDDALCDLDEGPCTDDVCEPGSGGGCTSTPVDCGGDVCNPMECIVNADLAECVPAAPPCDDDIACTTDSCDLEAGCAHVNNSAPCDDGLFCTVGDVCSAGECVGAEMDCSAGEACTTGTCNEDIPGCDNAPVVCDDGVACTLDTCDPVTGDCVFTPNNANCDDSNPCTADTCAPDAGGCLNGPVDPQAPHLTLIGPPSEGFGAAVWNTSGANAPSDEPPQTNHLPPFGCDGGPVYQYMASPDYGGITPGSTGAFYATDHGGASVGPNTALQTFVNHIEEHGYTLADLTFRYTVVNLGSDTEGYDWVAIPPWFEWRRYSGSPGTFTFDLDGEPMVGGDMTQVDVENDYAGCDSAAQMATVYMHDLEPVDVTTAATSQAVTTAATYFLAAFWQPLLQTSQISLCGFSVVSLTLQTFNDGDNGRSGGLFGMDGGLLIRPPLTGGIDGVGGGTGFD